jgi:riboflavin kinase/FMN adenylyltransferase
MNIGYNPTVAGENLSIEINYFDFDSAIYAQKISVSILKHLRPEQKFSSVDLLKEQLEKDKNTALDYINKTAISL